MTAPITIRPEMTPNPQTLRFVSNIALTDTPMEFKGASETTASPLARKLFGFPWTAGVFIGRDFVAVTKQDWVDWETLADPLTGLIQEHLERGLPVVVKLEAKTDGAPEKTDSSDVQVIKKVLNEEIRPAVALDGGDVEFHKFEDGIVYLYMKGACSGCPRSTMTLKMGIEARLMNAVPSVKEVVAL